MFGPPTLRLYVGKRFLFAILGAFAVCCALIYMIDMVELLRMSRKATSLSMAGLLWIGLLRLPAFTEILLAFKRAGADAVLTYAALATAERLRARD